MVIPKKLKTAEVMMASLLVVFESSVLTVRLSWRKAAARCRSNARTQENGHTVDLGKVDADEREVLAELVERTLRDIRS